MQGGGIGEPRDPEAARPGRRWTVALAGLVIVFAGLGGYDLVHSRGLLNASPAADSSSAVRNASSSRAGSQSASAKPGQSQVPAVSARVLTAVSAEAFGPNGTSDGDNPQLAANVLGGGSGKPWHSAWYATSRFGGLQQGTGLLLDMGHPMTITGVQLVLGSAAGADLEIRTGDVPFSGDLQTVTATAGSGGMVWLPLKNPVNDRYVLIWFTQLPPDGTGTYQVTVYSATPVGEP